MSSWKCRSKSGIISSHAKIIKLVLNLYIIKWKTQINKLYIYAEPILSFRGAENIGTQKVKCDEERCVKSPVTEPVEWILHMTVKFPDCHCQLTIRKSVIRILCTRAFYERILCKRLHSANVIWAVKKRSVSMWYQTENYT